MPTAPGKIFQSSEGWLLFRSIGIVISIWALKSVNQNSVLPGIRRASYFSWNRIDNSRVKSFSSGFNFRYANYYYLPEGTEWVEHRDLYKVFGIRFIFLISGKAGKFDIIPLLINIGMFLLDWNIHSFRFWIGSSNVSHFHFRFHNSLPSTGQQVL